MFYFFKKNTPKKSNAQIEAEEDEEERLKNKQPTTIYRNIPSSDFGPPSEILPGFLYLGAYSNICNNDLTQHAITYVLNVASECNYELQNMNYLKLIVDDMVPDGSHQHDLFERAFQFIDKAKEENRVCLVHCMRGRSRSAAIVIGYLMSRNKWTLQEAYGHVKERRYFIGPHYHLKVQLINYEVHMYKETSMSVQDFISRGYA